MLGLLSKAKRIKVITAMLYLFLMEPNGMMVGIAQQVGELWQRLTHEQGHISIVVQRT
jgi:hypothetical protein